ncbi:hypothetical protein CDD81_6160 [Ophiocordyceps australis]|uniref:Uncharacterized protein n=1 Tax=Ophiocordyceps australis TaxID=1399860 RepID=A0A2C5XHW1_9HYPO|nr:hypothetical protein CDD81_6160 [Ophiocordyceps australis]
MVPAPPPHFAWAALNVESYSACSWLPKHLDVTIDVLLLLSLILLFFSSSGLCTADDACWCPLTQAPDQPSTCGFLTLLLK